MAHAVNMGEGSERSTNYESSLNELTHGVNSPGRVFALNAEATYELIAGFEAQGLLRIDGQAGERIVRLEGRESADWLEGYYESELSAVETSALAG